MTLGGASQLRACIGLPAKPYSSFGKAKTE